MRAALHKPAGGHPPGRAKAAAMLMLSSDAQVNQEKLRYVNPAAREAMNATRTAFGADYEARLRAEAGAAPDKLSRRKHQISSLYHNAKMKARCSAASLFGAETLHYDALQRVGAGRHCFGDSFKPVSRRTKHRLNVNPRRSWR